LIVISSDDTPLLRAADGVKENTVK